jgi:serine/threonine protein kinase
MHLARKVAHIYAMTTEIYLTDYCPGDVTACLTMGTNSFIGFVDETTVLKYSHIPGDEKALAILGLEARILQTLGPHKHIIGFKGLTKDGLLLERARFGSITEYLKNNNPGLQRRLEWACQATEALATVHKKCVLHRDISANNLLLDAELNIKLSDFQGRLLSPDGEVEEDGLSVENTKSFMPRTNFNYADWKTEIFALGSAFYYIMEGHEPYPDLDPDHDEERIVERFTSGQFPEIECSSMNCVIHKCWAGKYDSVDAVLQDLEFVHECPMAGGVRLCCKAGGGPGDR